MPGTTTGEDRTARSSSSHHGPTTPRPILPGNRSSAGQSSAASSTNTSELHESPGQAQLPAQFWHPTPSDSRQLSGTTGRIESALQGSPRFQRSAYHLRNGISGSLPGEAPVSISRGFRAVLILGLLLITAACGSRALSRSSTVPASGQATDQLTGTVPLALQSSAPVWGGDSQPATTDIVRVAITPQQAADIAHACKNAPKELPSSGETTCQEHLFQLLPPLVPSLPPSETSLGPCENTLCLEVVGTSSGQEAQPDGFIQIVDMRPGAPLCSSDPGGLCFRLGAQNQVLQMLASAAAGGLPSSTLTPGPTDTSHGNRYW